MNTRAPIAAGMPTVTAIAVIICPLLALPNSKREARCLSDRPSGRSTSIS